MADLLLENWEQLAIFAAVAVGLFWPSLKPFTSKFQKVLKTKDDPATEENERVIEAIKLLQVIVEKFQERGDEDGVQRARELQKCLLDPPPAEGAPTK